MSRTTDSGTARERRLAILQLAVIVPTIVALATLSIASPGAFNYRLLLWVAEAPAASVSEIEDS